MRRVPVLRGWKRFLVAFGFGCLAALSMAPLRFLPALLVGLGGLALLVEGSRDAPRPLRSALATGTAYGAGYFGLGMMWLANAFLVQADQFAWMIPILLPAFFIFLGLFYGLAGMIHVALRRWRPLPGLAGLLPLVIGLMISEWLRGHILTGLPWNLHAQAAAMHTVLLQPLAALGPYAYGGVITILALLPAWALLEPRRARRAGLLFASISILILSFGGARMVLFTVETRTDAQVIIVQPNIAQRDKRDARKRGEGLRASVTATINAAAGTPEGVSTYAIWPENAYPFLNRIPELPEVLSRDLPERSYLISGSIRGVEEGYANTLLVFGPSEQGAPLAPAYDKHRLVPFGETLPFYEIFEALNLETLSPTGGRGFIPGEGPKRYELGPASFAPLICYEDVFPGTLFPQNERPDWLVVVTNDAWFGDSAGPMQHLDIARMRAVETALPLARSANTGISSLINPKGQVIQLLPLYEAGVITENLPAPGLVPLYGRLGGLIFFVMLAFIGGTKIYLGLQLGIVGDNRR